MPDLGDAYLGVGGRLVERRTRDVYFDDQIRRRIDIQTYPGLAPDVLLVLNIETDIGLEAALQILAPERRRTDAVNVDVHLFREHLDQRAMMWLVCSFSVRRAHYLQHTPVIGKSRHSDFLALRQQALVGLPAYVSQENRLL